jgi:GMP synthase (glutamine-hydrolysing)
MQKLLLLQVGHTFEEIARERGDYDAWFQRALGRSDEDFRALRVFAGEPLPVDFDYAGVVVTGSWSMVTDREPWSEASGDYLREAAQRGRPILGVCYGHQLLAQAFGGSVGFNPEGRHAGTARLELTAAAESDPLFAGFSSPMLVQVSHSQRVLAPPPGALLLGHCARDPYHAFRLGESCWGVQFHPEFDATVSRRYIELRRAKIVEEGLDPDALIAGVRASVDGERLLQRFAQLAR